MVVAFEDHTTVVAPAALRKRVEMVAQKLARRYAEFAEGAE
jgi:hypothetical protein